MIPLFPTLSDSCHESMRKKMQERISSQSSHSQGYQELYEVLVEHSLHDGDHQDTKDAAEREQQDGA